MPSFLQKKNLADRAKLIDRDNRDAFAGPLHTMHADRKTVFIDQLKWDLAVTDDALDIDEYDTENTLYLMVQDDVTGGHLGSVRLLATTGPHLLADKFAHLCADGVPRAADTYEITRLVTRPGLPRDAAERVREQLCVAIVEFALARDITAFTMMTHMAFLSAVIAVGWDCEPLGMPHDLDGVPVAALRITIDAATLVRLQEQWNFVAPVLRLDLSESALVV